MRRDSRVSANGRRGIRRAAALFAALAAGLALTATSVPAQQPAAPSTTKPADTPAPAPHVEVLPLIEKNVRVAGSDPKLATRLAGLEDDIIRGYRAKHTPGSEASAEGIYASALATLYSLRSDFLLQGNDPLVRDQNLSRGRFTDAPAGETWRPLSGYINRWMSLLSADAKADFSRRNVTLARHALEAAVESQSRAALRGVVSLYLYTLSGLSALERLVELSFEQGDFLDAASWLSMLRELRPDDYLAAPVNHLRYVLALSAMGEREQLDEAWAFAGRSLAGAKVTVGARELSLRAAYDELRSLFPETPRTQEPTVQALGAPTVLPLATRAEFGKTEARTVQYVDWDYQEPQAPIQTFMQPTLAGLGGIFPRLLNGIASGESQFVWYPSLDSTQDARWLTINETERFTPLLPVQGPNRGWWRPNRTGGGSPAIRVTGSTIATLPPVGTTGNDGLTGKAPTRALVAVIGTGRVMTAAYVGNQIQVFDMGREGALLMTLPLKDQMAPGDILIRDPKPAPVAAGAKPGAAAAPEEDPAIAAAAAEKAADDEAASAGTGLSPSDLGLLLSTTHFGGIPAVSADGLLYICGANAAKQSSESRVYCFDLTGKYTRKPGRIYWQRKLSGIAGLGGNGWNDPTPQLKEGSSVTLSGSRVLVCTNSGSVACLDGYDGELHWVVEYRQRDSAGAARFSWMYTPPRPTLAPEAPALHGASLIALPNDGVNGLSINALDGSVVRSLLRADRAFETVRYFLGERGAMAYFQTTSGLRAEPITHRRLVESAYGPPPGTAAPVGVSAPAGLAFAEPLESANLPEAFIDDYLRNVRGFISGEAVFLAGVSGLHRFNARTLAYESFVAWPDAPKPPEPTATANGAKPTTAEADPKKDPKRKKRMPADAPGTTTLTLIPGSQRADGKPVLLRLDTFRARVYPVAGN
jgi:outer membrane protein assembly factor BamB